MVIAKIAKIGGLSERPRHNPAECLADHPSMTSIATVATSAELRGSLKILAMLAILAILAMFRLPASAA
jgi:hypothetical protein